MKNVSVILTLVNETLALRETVETLMLDNSGAITEILVVTCARTTGASRAEAARLAERYPGLIEVFDQSLPLLGGAIRDGIARARAEWVLLLATDLETPPEFAKDLIARANAGDTDAVLASRWLSEDGLPGYPILKKAGNRVFQKFFGALYGSDLTDLTYGYWIRRRSSLTDLKLTEVNHAVTLECNLKQIRRGVKIVEVPVVWRRREDGESLFRLTYYAAYFRAGFSLRFRDLGGFKAFGP